MAKRSTKKTSRRKVAKKRVTKKKTTTRRPATRAVARPGRITGSVKPRTKSEVYSTIAEHTGIAKRDVALVFDVMSQMIAADLKKGKAGSFNVPGMMKVTVRRKPATKARKGINPFTGEPTTFKAKPAMNVVKIRPLKGLKDLV